MNDPLRYEEAEEHLLEHPEVETETLQVDANTVRTITRSSLEMLMEGKCQKL